MVSVGVPPRACGVKATVLRRARTLSSTAGAVVSGCGMLAACGRKHPWIREKGMLDRGHEPRPDAAWSFAEIRDINGLPALVGL